MLKMFESVQTPDRPMMPIDVIENTVDTITAYDKRDGLRGMIRAGDDARAKRFVFMTR